MADEPSALTAEPAPADEAEYQAFYATLTETARGRAFLAEHARRSRSADTAVLLASVQRLEGLVAGGPAPGESDEREELRALLDAIRTMHAELDTAALSMQVAKLAALVDVVQQRIESIVAPPRHEEAPAESADAAATDEAVANEEALEPVAPPEVGWFDSGSIGHAISAVAAAALAAETAEQESGRVIKAGTIPPPSPFAGEDFSASGPVVNRKAQALAPIMALSEEERLALFT